MIEINRFIKIEIYFAHFLALKMIEQSGGKQVMTIGNIDAMWFRGKDILKILEYGNDKDHRNRTLRQLEYEDRQSYGSLIEYFGLGPSDGPNYNENKPTTTRL